MPNTQLRSQQRLAFAYTILGPDSKPIIPIPGDHAVASLDDETVATINLDPVPVDGATISGFIVGVKPKLNSTLTVLLKRGDGSPDVKTIDQFDVVAKDSGPTYTLAFGTPIPLAK